MITIYPVFAAQKKQPFTNLVHI